MTSLRQKSNLERFVLTDTLAVSPNSEAEQFLNYGERLRLWVLPRPLPFLHYLSASAFYHL